MSALENALEEGNMMSNIALTHLMERPAGLLRFAPSIRSLERMELKMIENILSLKDAVEGINVELSHLSPLNLVVWSMHLEFTELLNEKRKILDLMEECMTAMDRREIPNIAASPGTISGRSSRGKEEIADMSTEDRKFIDRSLADLRSEVMKHSQIPVLIPVPPSEFDDRKGAVCGTIQDGPESGLRGEVGIDVHRPASPMGKEGKVGGEVISGADYPADNSIELREQSRLKSRMSGIMGAVGALGMLAAASRGISSPVREELLSEEGFEEPLSPLMEFEDIERIDPAAREGMENSFSSVPGAVFMLNLAAVDSRDQSAVGSIRVKLPDGTGGISDRSPPHCTIDEEKVEKRKLRALKDKSDEEERPGRKKKFPTKIEHTTPLTVAELKFPIPIPAMLEPSLSVSPTPEEHLSHIERTEIEQESIHGTVGSLGAGAIIERKTETDIPKRTLAEKNLHHVASAVSELSNIASDVIPIVTAAMGSHVPAPLFHPPEISRKERTFEPRGKEIAGNGDEGQFIPDPKSPGISSLGNVPDGYSEMMKKRIPAVKHLQEHTPGTIQWTPPGFEYPYQVTEPTRALGPEKGVSPDPSYEPYASCVPVEEMEIPLRTLHEQGEAQRELQYRIPSFDPSADQQVSSVSSDRGAALDRAIPETSPLVERESRNVERDTSISGEPRFHHITEGIAPDKSPLIQLDMSLPENRDERHPLLESSLSYGGRSEPYFGSRTYDAIRKIQETVRIGSLGSAPSGYTPFNFVSGRILGSAVAPFGMLSNICDDRQSIAETSLPVSLPGTSKAEIIWESGGPETVPTSEEGDVTLGPVIERQTEAFTGHRDITDSTEMDAQIPPSVPDVETFTIPRFPRFFGTSDITLDVPFGSFSGIPDLPVPFYWTREVPGKIKDEYFHTLITMMDGEIIRDPFRGLVIPREYIDPSLIHSSPGSLGKAGSGGMRHVADVGRPGIFRVRPMSPVTPAMMSAPPKVPDSATTEKKSSDEPLSESLDRLRALKDRDLLGSDVNETKKEKNDEMYGMVKNENNGSGDMSRGNELRVVERMLRKEAKRYGLVFR